MDDYMEERTVKAEPVYSLEGCIQAKEIGDLFTDDELADIPTLIN